MAKKNIKRKRKQISRKQKKSGVKYTKAEQKAYNVGKGYAAGKTGTPVPYEGKNRTSFVNGYKAGQKLLPKYEKASFKKDK